MSNGTPAPAPPVSPTFAAAVAAAANLAPGSSATNSPLIVALIADLPPVGSTFSHHDQKNWFELAIAAFKSLYPADAHAPTVAVSSAPSPVATVADDTSDGGSTSSSDGAGDGASSSSSSTSSASDGS